MMNLENIETADCKIISHDYDETNRKLSILFEQIFDVENKKFISNMKVVIENWKGLSIFLHHQREPFGETRVEELSESGAVNYSFQNIQEISRTSKFIELRGFAKENGWMIYRFERPVETCVEEQLN